MGDLLVHASLVPQQGGLYVERLTLEASSAQLQGAILPLIRTATVNHVWWGADSPPEGPLLSELTEIADQVIVDSLTLDVPPFVPEQRLDLTHLDVYAIDDEGNRDPDDAVGIETLPGGLTRLWVHVADVAALAPADSPLDLEARARGATLYLPDRTVGMLPDALVEQAGLGLHDTTVCHMARGDNARTEASWWLSASSLSMMVA